MGRTFIESLEGRQLLAADLSVALTSTTLADSLLVGGTNKPATAVVTVSNVGDAISKTNKGKVNVTVGLKNGSGQVTSLGTGTVTANKLGKATVKLAVPTSLAAGNYSLVAIVDGGSVVTETNTANNTATGKNVSAAVANSDLELTASMSLSGTVATQTSGTISGSIKNVGNVDAKTSGKVEITSTINGVTTVLGTIDKLKLNVKAGKTMTLKTTSFKVIGVSGGNVTATIGARLVMTPPTSGNQTGNDSVTMGTLTVTPPPPGPLDAIHLGSKMSFKATQSISHNGIGFETGTWKDDQGHTGKYYMPTSGGKQALLGLQDMNGTPLAGIQVTVNAGVPKLSGGTFVLGVPQAGSLGSWNVAGQTVYFAKGK